ncbi:MAG TPA: hypothetical protein VIV11_13740 [Kofleriaceae bacterium]
MSKLAPCPGCKRHVATRETACPFCARALAPRRAQHIVLIGRVSRAAVFSAALAACTEEKPKPAPVPPAQGSDDLEKLLDHQPRPVEPAAAPSDAAISDAALAESDAAIVVDAGVRPDAGVVKKKKKKQTPEEVIQKPDFDHHKAMPYGAPPARRRIV